MVQITCDNCGAVKPEKLTTTSDGEWVVGYDLEVETPNSLRRSLTFLDRWDDRRVLELGAIHLCSEACRQAYVDASKAA